MNFFFHLNPLLSFMDFGLIDFFIKRFGSDGLKKDMRSYCCEMKIFMKETTIRQLIDYFPGQPEVPPKFSLLQAKIDNDASKCTLEQINTIRKKYCSEVKLSEIVFHLVSIVDSNSFVIKWIVPQIVISDIMKCTRYIKNKFFQKHRITFITLDNMWLYVSETELEDMWLHVSNTTLIDRFHIIHKQIVHELKMEEISIGRLSQCLIDQQQNLPRSTSIFLSRIIINSPFLPSASFIDFKIISVIVEQFGSDCLKNVMESYCRYVSVYLKQLTVQQLLDFPLVHTKLDEGFMEAECGIMKEPSGFTCDRILSIKNSICAEVSSSQVVFTMSHVRKPLCNSFSVSWLVPSHLASRLIVSASQINNEFFVRKSITSLSIGNQWVYNPKLNLFGAKIKEKYQQSQSSPSPVEWIPSPTKKIFRLAMIQRERVQRGCIEDRFVQMTISGRVDDILQAKFPVELEHIFRNTVHGGEIILIEGAPGSGKSTLTVHICQRWGRGELFQQFTIVILVQLRDPAVQRARTIADLLPVENTQEIAIELIAINGRGVLWVLDGWDELPSHLQEDSIFRKLLPTKPNVSKIEEITKDPSYAKYVAVGCSNEELWATYLQKNPQHDQLLNNCSVIVTSRPISSSDLHPVVSSRIEVLGFTPEEQKQYFTECLKGDTEALEALFEKIEGNPVVQSICYLPLNAAFIVHNFKYRGHSLPNTEYEIYLSVILSCIQRHFERGGRGHDLPRQIASLDDLSRSEAVREAFHCLCELAYRGVMENKLTFSSSDLPRGSNTLSLLQAIESFLQSGKSMFYNFLHLSIQEILSSYYIGTWLSDSEQVSRFQDLFNQPRFIAVFRFYAAFTKLKSPGIRQVIAKMLEANSKPLLVSLLHCLHEAQDPSLCLYVAERLKYELDVRDTSLSPLDCLPISFFLHSIIGKKIGINLTNCSIGDLGDFGTKCLTKYLSGDEDQVRKITVNLCHNKIRDESTSNIAMMLYFVEHIYLSSNPIGDTGASLISEAVRETATLKTLILHRCDITSIGAEDLSRALAKNSSLKKLDIGVNNIGDNGVRNLAEALKRNKQLKELWISWCGMTDKGATSLASALSVNNSLKVLHMGEGNLGLTENGISTIIKSLASNLEFVKLALSSDFNSTSIGPLTQEINEEKKRNGLPPIEVEGTNVIVTYAPSKYTNDLPLLISYV